MVMRSEGAGRPSLPKAEAGIKVGKAMAAPAAPVTLRKLRRLRRAGVELPFVIVLHHGPEPVRKTREKNDFFQRRAIVMFGPSVLPMSFGLFAGAVFEKN